MKRLLAAGLIVLCAASARAQDQVDALKKSFLPQEQVLLSGVLVDAANQQAFAADAKGGPTGQTQTKWRAEIAQFSRDYLDHPHGLNLKGRTVQEMGEPAEWAILMTSLKFLADGSITDKIKFKIFLGRLDDANDDLKDGDSKSAIKFIGEARQILAKACTDYLATPGGRAALADAARRKQEAAAKASDDARKAEQLKADQLKAEADARAEAERKAREQAAAVAATPKPVSKPSASKPPEPAPAKTPSSSSALEQARNADAAGRTTGSDERTSAELNGSFDGGKQAAGPVPVSLPAGSGEGTRTAPALLPSTPHQSQTPSLVVRPPEDPDLAQLHQMKKKVSGFKKWGIAGGGGLLGALIGFLVGGPIGAVIGAVLGGGGGFFLGKKLFG
jgi:hypothetical protein